MQKIFTATLVGYEAALVEIETDISNGLPATIIVGLPDTMVQESKERVRSALRHTSFNYPSTRVSINLAPSNLPKFGSHFDLGIALSILLVGGLVDFDPTDKLFIGELALDGQLRPSNGVLSMILAAKIAGIKEIFVPVANLKEASLIEGVKIFGIQSLNELILHLLGETTINPAGNAFYIENKINLDLDFAQIYGQGHAKRALEIAAAGGHNLRMVGAPGSGKTMLAKALVGILTPPSRDELIEIMNLHSLAGERPKAVSLLRPFRNPHHTSSSIALIGGGARPKPGEVSLAHRGVLFLDEFPEFPRTVLEVLRQPLEDGMVTIARASHTVKFPARFMLVAAQNPCPCGNFGDQKLECKCHPAEIDKYNKKVSGPLLDRIDIHLNVPRLSYLEFSQNQPSETSLQIRKRVTRARDIQRKRFNSSLLNSHMNNQQIKKYCELDLPSKNLLSQAADKYVLSGRSINKILRLARTVADLDFKKNIEHQHLAEALQYKI